MVPSNINNDQILAVDQSNQPKVNNNNDDNVIAIVFMLLIGSMQCTQNMVMTDAKLLNANAQVQNYLNSQNNQIKFSQLPSGHVGQATIDAIQARNEQYAKEREDIQNMLMLTRQIGQEEMANTNTSVDSVEQAAAQDTGWLKTEGSAGQLIAQLLKNS